MRIREKKVKKVYIIYDLRYVKCIDKRKNDIPVKDFNLLKYTFKGMVWQIGKALKRGTVSEKESKTSSYSDCRSTGSVYYLAVRLFTHYIIVFCYLGPIKLFLISVFAKYSVLSKRAKVDSQRNPLTLLGPTGANPLLINEYQTLIQQYQSLT